MAAVVGTVLDVSSITTPAGPKKTTAGAELKCAVIDVTYAGTYATAGGKSTVSNVHTAIANALRDGKTISVISAACAAPGDLNGTAIGASVVSVSGNVISATLTQADAVTEIADGLMSTAWNEGIKFHVYFTAA